MPAAGDRTVRHRLKRSPIPLQSGSRPESGTDQRARTNSMNARDLAVLDDRRHDPARRSQIAGDAWT